MAHHSSALAWRIPGTGEPGGLPSMGSHRVGHDWSDLAAAAAAIIIVIGVPWWFSSRICLPVQQTQLQSLGWEDPPEKKWLPTPVFLPGKSHGQRSQVGGVAKCRTRLSAWQKQQEKQQLLLLLLLVLFSFTLPLAFLGKHSEWFLVPRKDSMYLSLSTLEEIVILWQGTELINSCKCFKDEKKRMLLFVFPHSFKCAIFWLKCCT